jgi:hypothetical protein
MHFIICYAVTFVIVAVGMLAGAGLLHLIPRRGPTGKRISEALCVAPGLDVVVTYFTAAPLIVGPIAAGWAGLLGAITGQVVSVLIWTGLHERINHHKVREPRITTVLNRIVGRWNNHAALWLTAIVTPIFWLIRMCEIFIYPPFRWLVKFPRYDSSEWVRVSRHKFDGLIGQDLIWCLYCDWMTGVWSLGSEILRNVESFWCPIRFDDAKKCANCSIDFPDLNKGWIDAGGQIAQVGTLLQDAHGGDTHAWFGHPVRLTVNGKEPDQTKK